MLHSVIERFHLIQVLCLGDVMLDRFIVGSVQRISPERPVPVLTAASTDLFAGGAANVARNIAALGGRCTVVGVVGDDSAGEDLSRLLHATAGIEIQLVLAGDRPTTEKTRFVAQGQHMLRVDRENSGPIPREIEARLLEIVEEQLGRHQVLVLSDYAKGVLTARVVRGAIELARARGVPVVVDPKSSDLARYNGASIITPNTGEAFAATGINPADDGGAEAAGQCILDRTDVGSALITRAEKGMSLFERLAEPLHIAATAQEVTDTVGAGDTVIATLALAIGAGARHAEAACLANTAAGLVVAKRGTATVTRSELLSDFDRKSDKGLVSPLIKVRSREEASEQVAAWRADGLSVGFTNGCFDILHTGHIAILNYSRSNCDRLIIGLNTDASVRRLKGPNRPVNGQKDRAMLIAALAVVDAVVLFDEDTPGALIDLLKPDVLVKGADYTIDQIVGAETVLANGGRVLRFELVPHHSTTRTIAKLSMGAK